MLGAVLINPALTKLSVIHALPKEENLNILSQNIYRKILPKEKNIFLCSSQIEKNSIRSPKNKAFNRKLHKDAIPTIFSHQTETNIGKSTNNRVHSVWKVRENNIPGKAGLESQGLSAKKSNFFSCASKLHGRLSSSLFFLTVGTSLFQYFKRL